MIKILNLGSINIDYVYTVSHFVQAGETLSASERNVFPGGKGMNQSIALARASSDVVHAGMVGADGTFLIDILKSAGVDTSLVKTGDVPTGHTIIQVDQNGENCILLLAGANQEINQEFVDRMLESFTQDDILLLQNEVSCVPYAIKKAKDRGMRVAFNPSPFTSEILSYPIDLIDWWILNEIECQALSGIDKNSPRDMLTKMSEMFPKAEIVLTLGENGVLCYSNNNIIEHKSYKANVIDTTAAGDTFTGYFLSAIAKGMGIEKALQLASIAASITVSRLGAASSIPELSEVLDRL